MGGQDSLVLVLKTVGHARSVHAIFAKSELNMEARVVIRGRLFGSQDEDDVSWDWA